MMLIVILYLVSVFLFALIARITIWLFIPLNWIIKAVTKDSIPALNLVGFSSFLNAILLMYLTKYLWSLIDYQIGWPFPLLVALYHFIINRSPQSDTSTKFVTGGIIIGSLLFLLLTLFQTGT